MGAEDVNAFLALLHGATQVAEGLGTVADAAGPVLATVDGVVNHLATPATLERVAGAAVAAAAGAVVAEARAGAEMRSKPAAPPVEPTVEPATVRCSRHGEQEWHGTIACKNCGLVYQLHYPDAPLHAPDRCACGARLRPAAADEGGSVEPVCAGVLCTSCFVAIARKGARAVRAPGHGGTA